MFNDLREYITQVEQLGECRVIEGADWNLEIGAITEWQARPNTPLLLFDKIKGYEQGYRIVSNWVASLRRLALLFGLPEAKSPIEVVGAWHSKFKAGFKPVPPVEVKAGPVKENILTGDDVDLYKFPTPKWHELDGGRYIGTADMVIMRDPDEGWVNLSTQRVQIHDKTTATIYFNKDGGQQGDIIRRKYWAKGQACPVAVSCGQDPLLWCVAPLRVPWGVSEYDYAGWFKNKPIEVTRGVTTDLPLPAAAEIVLEGEIVPPEVETRLEGPFGEYTGYYAGGAGPEPAFRVKSILHRDAPILLGYNQLRMAPISSAGYKVVKAAQVWDELDRVVTNIRGVWFIDDAGGANMPVVSIKQQYAGHAKMAALAIKAALAPAGISRFVIVVDDDIDPSNISEVLWALGTRCDPETHIDIIRECVTNPIDPILSPEKRARKEYTSSTAVIIACKPYHWLKDFAPSIKTSAEFMQKTKAKWQKLLQ